MAIEIEEADKKNQDNKPGPVAETILEGAALNEGDSTVEAEMAIRGFVGNRLEEFHNQVEGAIDTLEQWILTQTGEARTTFDSYGSFGFLGDMFIAELQRLVGGAGTPIMDAIGREVYNTVSWAQHAEFEAQGFLYHMRRSIRDASWFVRDNVGAVLHAQWPQLLHLAAEGSTDFVGPLLHLGLPSVNFNPVQFGDNMVQNARAYRDIHAPAKEAVAAESQQQAPEQKQEMDDAAKKEQQQLAQDETKREQLTV